MTKNDITGIDESVYREYVKALLNGDRQFCAQTVQNLLDKGTNVRVIYQNLFQKSLYQVGRLWETNRISVAREHLATSVTESLLNLVYPFIFSGEKTGRKAVISCTANEYHQVGGKIVADMFELNGWDSHFLGANTPIEDLLEHIQEIKPDLVGLSLSVYFNLPVLKQTIQTFRSSFADIDLIIGGQAFNWGGEETLSQFTNIRLITSLTSLEQLIQKEY